MKLIEKLLTWHNREEEEMKEKKTEDALQRAKNVEDRIKKLAQSYRAAGLLVYKVRNQHR